MKEKALHLELTAEDYERLELEDVSMEYKGHIGTHIDCYTGVPDQNEYQIDVVALDCRDGLPGADAFQNLDLEGKALMLYTGNLAANGYGTKEYFMYDIGMTWDTLQQLIDKQPKFILVDSHGLGLFSQRRFFDIAFEKNGCFVIMSAFFEGEEILNVKKVRIEIDVDMPSSGKPCKIFTL